MTSHDRSLNQWIWRVWIRATIPLLCLAVLLSNPDHPYWAGALFAISAGDNVIHGVAGALLRSAPHDRDAAWRDTAYAAAFYLVFVHSTRVPALALAPTVLAEAAVVFGWRYFYPLLTVEMVLLILRMGMMGYNHHRLVHPSWSIGVAAASILAGLLGLQVARLKQAEAEIAGQRIHLKRAIEDLLTLALAERGQVNPAVRSHLNEIFAVADAVPTRELGRRLSELTARKLEAAHLLTAEEQDIVRLMGHGLSLADIAARVHRSEAEVRARVAAIVHRTNLYGLEQGKRGLWRRPGH